MKSNVIGKRLKALRINLGQSKAYVARKLGIKYSTLCSYEYGIHIPRGRNKAALANYYGVSVEELFFDENEYET